MTLLSKVILVVNVSAYLEARHYPGATEGEEASSRGVIYRSDREAREDVERYLAERRITWGDSLSDSEMHSYIMESLDYFTTPLDEVDEDAEEHLLYYTWEEQPDVIQCLQDHGGEIQSIFVGRTFHAEVEDQIQEFLHVFRERFAK
jgi:hypothetical protein